MEAGSNLSTQLVELIRRVCVCDYVCAGLHRWSHCCLHSCPMASLTTVYRSCWASSRTLLFLETVPAYISQLGPAPSPTLSLPARVSMAEEIPMDWVGTRLAWRSRGRYSVSITECRTDRLGHSLLFIARYLEKISQERLIQGGSHLSLTYHSRFIQTNIPLGMFLPSCLSLYEICQCECVDSLLCVSRSYSYKTAVMLFCY